MTAESAREPQPSPAAMEAERRVDECLAELSPLLRRAVSHQTVSRLGIDPAEVEQDVRIRLWRALRDERNITHAASYLYRVAATAAIDAVRRLRARREEPLDDQTSDRADPRTNPSTRAERSVDERVALRQTLRTALTALETDRRRVVCLHLQGLTTIEIGRLLGWTEPRVRNLVYRGLDDLRRELARLGVTSASQ